MKILRSSRDTNTPHVYRLDIGLDTPRFPGHEVACSTRVIVTADVSTVTDTLSHSNAVTSQSRGIQAADDVTPVPREISRLFVSPTSDVVDRVQTGSGIKTDTVGQDSDVGDPPVFHEVSEAASSRKSLSDNNTPSGQSLKAAASPFVGTSACFGTQYRTMGTETTPEYLSTGTNTPLRTFASDSTNTAILADVACNTAAWRYTMARENVATHDDAQYSTVMIESRSVETNSEAISFVARRSSSMPSSLEHLIRTSYGMGTSSEIRDAELRPVMTGTPTNIPDSETLGTYQPTRLDSEQVVPERNDRNYDNGHVVKQVPVTDRQLCTCCRRAMRERNSPETEVSGSNSLVNHTDSTPDERVDGRHWRTDGESRQDLRELPADGKTDVISDSPTVTYQDQAVGNDDVAFPVVECGIGDGTVWTESRGTGDGTVLTADVQTSTPTVAVVDRASGTRFVQLFHKNEATDSQQTTSVGTSPAEDVTSAYRGLLAATQSRPVTVHRGTATPPAPATVDRETVTEHRKLVDCGTSPAVDVTAAYRGLLGARLTASSKVTVSRGTLTAPLLTTSVDKDTVTDCTMVDRASSPIKVYFRPWIENSNFTNFKKI